MEIILIITSISTFLIGLFLGKKWQKQEVKHIYIREPERESKPVIVKHKGFVSSANKKQNTSKKTYDIN